MTKTHDVINLDVAHFSMQYSDVEKQKKADVNHIFSRGYDWATGTEAGEEPLKSILRASAKAHGYTFHEFKSNWISIHKSMIVPLTHVRDSVTVVDNDLFVGGFGHDLSIVWDTFLHRQLGRITIMASHYKVKGRPVPNPEYRVNLPWNKRLAKAIGAKGRLFGAGKSLVFYQGDQNILDRIHDTFLGQADFTSTWDELGRWEDTGHGNIDVIASYDPDTRVKARYVRALDDSELFMFSDHHPVESGFSVQALR